MFKRIVSFPALLGLVVTAGLVACANPDDGRGYGQHHMGQPAEAAAGGSPGATQSTGGMMGAGMTGSGTGCPMTDCGSARMMDKDAMCAMYRSMRDAPTEQARQAMMERNMPAMSPETRLKHMEMMRQQCQ